MNWRKTQEIPLVSGEALARVGSEICAMGLFMEIFTAPCELGARIMLVDKFL